MIKYAFLSFFSLVAFSCLAQKKTDKSLNLLTYNIRFSTPNDGVNAWTNRKDWVKELVEFYDTDILCVQEALKDQVEYILKDSRFEMEGVGRDEGKTRGEYTAVFYDKSRFKKMKAGTFWLSETPEIASKGWDAQIIRICTWVKLYDKKSKKDFFVFNTHYDHMGLIARDKSSELLKEKIKLIAGNSPVILSGDLNTQPETRPISTLKTFLSDAKDISKAKPYGPEGTFSAFNFNAELKERIDYIFVNDQIDVMKFAVLSDSKNQRYPSDHLPVMVRLRIK
ncbi:endonuclease/exonuclease/phosphatase family protein [Daejeonella oryzae]|uniref:endonuclease/exonuclease/phosphatase family protein n=1 Tax=Daejeonella oryzae TaxID=1122943 RepID=UPI000415C111|nr:endonuclease/exonuclease/phosphatase family protein [Daejeonella oryzae]